MTKIGNKLKVCVLQKYDAKCTAVFISHKIKTHHECKPKRFQDKIVKVFRHNV